MAKTQSNGRSTKSTPTTPAGGRPRTPSKGQSGGRPPAKQGAQQARQAKLDAARKARSTGPNKIIVGAVVVVLAIVAVVAGVIINSERTKDQISQGGKAVPVGAAGMGKGWFSNHDVTLVGGAPTVSVFEDFRCPVCKTFEGAFGESLETAAAAGKIRLIYHFKTVIDSNTGLDSSKVAASNALCAADQGAFPKYHDALFANQPASESTPFTDAQFTSFAKQAGLSGDKLAAWQSCADANKYTNYVKSVEDASFKAGITGTPAFYINNQGVNWGSFTTADSQPDTAAFEKAITTGQVTDAQKDPKLPKIND